MKPENYETKEVIELKFQAMHTRFDTQDKVLNDIRKGVEYTNGSVGELKKEVGILQNWRWMLTGGMIIMSMFVIPMAIFIFKDRTDVSRQISEGLEKALSAYEVEE
jgi:hypothetical protein